MSNLKIRTLSSLAKVFEDEVYGTDISIVEVAKNQEFNYQLALLGEGEYSFEIKSAIEGLCAYRVGYSYVGMPTYEGIDDGKYLRLEAGNFPDPLFPLDENKIMLEKGKYTALWLCVEPRTDLLLPVGDNKIELVFYKDGKAVAQSEMCIRVHNVLLPEQSLLFTQWFHNDCIASVHEVEIFSAGHWALIEKYIRLAARHGMNMLLTPVLTPPLDTEVGEERPTVQLVDIVKCGNRYEFDFSRLEKYIKIATECGISYFEINHFFTQWGAEHAPKVIATVDGEKKQIFGWATDASSEEYADFLRALIPAVIKKFEELGIKRRNLYFHVSDEPSGQHLEAYSRAFKMIKPLVRGTHQIDALSNLDFYKARVVKTPVVATSDIEPFIEAGVSDLWCYYCCGQSVEVGNRFIAMPSERNRILGVQMWKYDIVGFLHWGYNFYYTRLSKRQKLNPYEETDAGGGFPSGDAFSVYPYGDDVIPSLRQKVFKEALNDHRLLSLIDKKTSHKRLLDDVVSECFGEDLSFKRYPVVEKPFFDMTRKIFEMLSELEERNEKLR